MTDPEVWLRTHRFGGKLFVIVGLAMAICGGIGVGTRWVVAAALLAALATVVYSHLVYLRLEANRERS